MPERIAARLVTGPAAFLVGWLLDMHGYLRAGRRARRAAASTGSAGSTGSSGSARSGGQIT